MWILLRRAAKILVRNKLVNSIRLFQILIFAFMLGSIWFGKGRSEKLEDRVSVLGILFFIVINQSGAAYGTLLAYPLERNILFRESAVQMYRLSTHFLTKSLVDALKGVIFTLIFTSILYFLVGLQATFEAFAKFNLVILLLTLFCEALAYAVSILTDNPQASSSVVTTFIVIFLLLGGYFAPANTVPEWLRWTRFLSFMFYGYYALADIEFPPDSRDEISVFVRRNAQLNTFSYWQNCGMLLAATVVLKLLAFLLLKYVRNPKFLKT